MLSRLIKWLKNTKHFSIPVKLEEKRAKNSKKGSEESSKFMKSK
jgi:hypothetical protein